MSKKVLNVTEIDLSILKSNPPQLAIAAKGTVSSGGWTNAMLIPHKKSEKGIYSFDFVADPPNGASTQMITKTSAFTVINPIPDDLKGIKIVAANNDLTETTINQEVGLTKQDPELEVLFGFELKNKKMRLLVGSNGCTEKNFFNIQVAPGTTGVYADIWVYRIQQDPCEAFIPGGVYLEWSYEELGIGENMIINLHNPFIQANPVIWQSLSHNKLKGAKEKHLLDRNEIQDRINPIGLTPRPDQPYPPHPWPWPFGPQPWPRGPWGPTGPWPWGPWGPDWQKEIEQLLKDQLDRVSRSNPFQ